jgi:PEP-CTERM motif
MRKNMVLTLLSVLLMIVSNTASAASCSYMASACMDGDMKNDSEKSMYSDKHFDAAIWSLLTKIEDLLVKVKEHRKGNSSYWGDNDEYDKPEKNHKSEKDGKHAKGDKPKGDKYRKPGKHENDGRYGKGEKHGRGDRWLAYLDRQDDFEGFWMTGGHGKKGHHGFEGRHGDKDWMKDLHKPHHGGDLPEVPVPAALWLFGSGLIGLAAFSRRKRR